MRLEILVDSEEPVIYPLNKPEIIIGSGDSCDIILGSSGVSRKHIKVLVEGDNFFVIDQGSTNGTFINEERLVPGRKTEFTSFFPVRLGGRVLLTLLSDEEAQDSILKEFSSPKPVSSAASPSDSTRVLSLKDIQQSSTKKLVKNRQEIVAKKKSNKPEAKKAKTQTDLSMLKTIFAAVAILAAGIYYNSFYNEPVVAPATEVVLKPMTEEELKKIQKASEVAPVIEVNEALLIPEEDLLPISRIQALFGDLKCLIPEETYFCELIPDLKKGNSGVAAVGESMVFLVNQTPWFEQAATLKSKRLKGFTDTLENQARDVEIQKLGLSYFILQRLKLASMEDYKEKNIYIAFYLENDKELAVTKVFAFKAGLFPNIVTQVETQVFSNYEKDVGLAFSIIDTLYRMY